MLSWLRNKYVERVSRQFHKIYYEPVVGESKWWSTVFWLGVPAQKCPLDLWIYQEILHRTRPDIIVETGVYWGGSTMYLASMCDLLGHGQILACDITLANVHQGVREHPRIRLFESSSTDPQVVAEIARECQGKRTMVILDSDHSKKHVLAELQAYSPLVSEGCYLICEDTNVNGHPVARNFGPGPYEAVEEFLRENSLWEVDRNCERLLLTFNPRGYLRRLPNSPAS